MPRKIKPFIVLSLSALFVTMCRFYDQNARVIPFEGMSCQPFTDYFSQALNVSKGLECYYTCPDESVVGPLDFETDPSLTFAEGDLDRKFCNVEPQFTATEPVASPSLTEDVSPTPASTDSPTPQASPTPEISPTPDSPLLTGLVTMCDTGANLISFRMTQPPPDLTEDRLVVQIADLDSTCSVNPTNPSLLTCTIPPAVIFPARVLVSLNGAIVNDFIYNGIGCDQLTTPVPTTTP
ncbi:MAG TPA: hypothetical protein VJ821_08535 [Anaerolineales bacterium]|nr:hypothetical protein [Anaerolineales bacterium]